MTYEERERAFRSLVLLKTFQYRRKNGYKEAFAPMMKRSR